MNILFVNNNPFNPIAGGIERVTDVLTKELLKRGYVVYYLCGKLPSSKMFLCDYEFPAKVYQLPNDGLFDDEKNIAFYKSLLLDLKVDVVINQRGLGGQFNALLPITHTKIISVVHSTPDSCITLFLDQLVELTSPPFVKLKKTIKNILLPIISCYWKRRATLDLKNKYNELVQNSDAIVTLSCRDIEVFKEFINNTPHKAKLVSIPNPNTFDAMDLSINNKEKIILYVGRLAKLQKKPLRMLKIWEYLYKKYPDWKLIVVGDGGERNNMQRYVIERNLKSVVFEGVQQNVAEYYKKSAFICLTSDFEGWGMTLTEGMQYGCIPFTFNNYGAAYDIINDGVDGCIIPAFDLKKYAKRMSELMRDEVRCLEMSKSAIEKVKKYSVENVVDKWDVLLSSC